MRSSPTLAAPIAMATSTRARRDGCRCSFPASRFPLPDFSASRAPSPILFLRDEPRAALIGHVRIPPLQQHTQAVGEAGEIEYVHEQPRPPRRIPRDMHASEIRYRLVAPDRREIPLVEVVEVGSRLAIQEPQDVRGSR